MIGSIEPPIVFSDFIERLVEQHSHQLSLRWRAIWIGNLQHPLLLLTWGEAVAESLPGDHQPLVGLRFLYHLTMTV